MKLLRTLIGWIIGLPLLFGVVVLAAANRNAVEVDLWLLPWRLNIPLSFLVLGAFAAGLGLGGLVVWLPSLALKQRLRRSQKRADQLEKHLQSLNSTVAKFP